jgi:hypothetical protein
MSESREFGGSGHCLLKMQKEENVIKNRPNLFGKVGKTYVLKKVSFLGKVSPRLRNVQQMSYRFAFRNLAKHLYIFWQFRKS